MDHRGVAEHIAERPAQPLASVDHAQHTPVEREPAGQQVLQQLGAHHGVLRRAQAQSQRDLGPVARDPQDHDHRLLRHHDAIHEQGHHLEPLQAPRELLVQSLPGPPYHGPTDGTLAAASGAPPARPRLETVLVVAHRHSGEQLLHHPRGQQIRVPKHRHRRQGRFPASRPPHPGPSDLDASAAERQLRGRRAPVMMRARDLMPALRRGSPGVGAARTRRSESRASDRRRGSPPRISA